MRYCCVSEMIKDSELLFCSLPIMNFLLTNTFFARHGFRMGVFRIDCCIFIKVFHKAPAYTYI